MGYHKRKEWNEMRTPRTSIGISMKVYDRMCALKGEYETFNGFIMRACDALEEVEGSQCYPSSL